MGDCTVLVDGREVKLTNLNKIFWPREGISKAHLVKYYTEVADYILPYMENRPLVMKRYPDGIEGGSFYQKECPAYAPEWMEMYSVRHSGKNVNYIICRSKAALLWVVNQGCIEIHAWLSTVKDIEKPDIAVIDLDPAEGANFCDAVEVARAVKKILDYFNMKSFIKTSGSRGIHIFIPIVPEFIFKEVTKKVRLIALFTENLLPEKVTLEKKIEHRKGKVYIDYLQNARGRSMAFPYSLRPLPGAPVSMPLSWGEIDKTSSAQEYNINTIIKKQITAGDPWKDFFCAGQSLAGLEQLAFTACELKL